MSLWAIETRFGEPALEAFGEIDPRAPGNPAYRLYRTKREATAAIRRRYGYIATRRDLRGPPYNWRMPRAVKVVVRYAEQDDGTA